MFRQDMEEGGVFPEGFAWGRILSADEINEWYVHILLFGRRVFVASGRYHGKRSFRWLNIARN